MATYVLPNIYFLNPVRTTLEKLKVLELFEKCGMDFRCKPFSSGGELNIQYAKHFAEEYFIKGFYTREQLVYLPSFPLKGAHKCSKVIVFGNGPSLKKFDLSKITDAVTVGTNTASEFYHCDYVFISSPYALLRAQRYFDLEKSTLLVNAGMWHGKARRDIWSRSPGKVVPIDSDFEQKWDLSEGKLVGAGPLCGHTAIDMAILMGASSILVVGCDGYKGKKLEQMYAGEYAKVYKKALSQRHGIRQYEQMLWDREEEMENKYVLRQTYCQNNGIRFAVWGKDNTYTKLKRITDEELQEWC